MATVTVKKLDEFGTAFGGGMKLVRDGMGVESFGVQVIEFPPNADQYPEPDHNHDGQEELYTVLEGACTLQCGGESYELTPGTFARVDAGQKRKLVTGDQGARVLAIGGVPGKVYEVQEFTRAAAA
jgi:uncharacterized cupin superfamily protein